MLVRPPVRSPRMARRAGGLRHAAAWIVRLRLTPEETARNRALVPIRSAIERVFGTLKRSYGWTRVRYRGLARNAAPLDLPCLALNLRRLDVLTR